MSKVSKNQELLESNMKYIRERIGLTQDRAAEILQVSRSTIARCESGEREVETTFERFQLLSNMIKEATGVDIGSIPGFRFSEPHGQAIFEHYEKLREIRSSKA